MDITTHSPILIEIRKDYPASAEPITMSTPTETQYANLGTYDPIKGYEQAFIRGWAYHQTIIHANARAKGFWDKERNDGEALALIHSEVSEALEALREGNPPSQKAPGFSCVEEECADVLIRIMDLAAGRGWDVAGALLAKIKHNAGRPPMHGKEF